MSVEQTRLESLEAQVVTLSGQIAQLNKLPGHGLPKGVKVAAPQPFVGKSDGDSVKNFLDQVENYFALMQVTDSNQKARYTETLLINEARTWFSTQAYELGRLRWSQLKHDLLEAFRPADFRRQARQALVRCKQQTPDVSAYIAKFNQLYNRCSDVGETEAQFFFEEGLWPEVAVQVLAQSPADLKLSQSLAQRISQVIRASNGKNGKGGKFFQPNLSDQGPSSQTTGSGSGYAPMQLGNAHGQKAGKRDIVCYRCGKSGHIRKDCRVNLQNGSKQNKSPGFKQKPQANGAKQGRLAKVEGELAEGRVQRDNPLPNLQNSFGGLASDVSLDALAAGMTRCRVVQHGASQSDPGQPARHGKDRNQKKIAPKVVKNLECARFTSLDSDTSPKLLEVLVGIGTQVTTALIDSGATHSFIQESECERLGLNIGQGDPLNIILADSSQIESNKVSTVAIRFVGMEDDRKHEHLIEQCCRVVPQLSSKLILGMDFLKKFNPEINWVDHALRFPGSGFAFQGMHHGPATVEICSLKGIEHTVKSTGNTAWFSLLRPCEMKPQIRGASPDDEFAGLKAKIDGLCGEYADIFAELDNVPPKRGMEYPIKLIDEQKSPPRPRQYRLSQPEIAEVKKQVTELLAKGWIRPSVSPYGAPILFVRKKTGELRMCVDFRMLNRNTRLDQHPIPRIADMLDKLSNARIFSSVDLANAYHQVQIKEEDQYKTAFLTPFGLYEYVVMPFGLTNCPSHFQRLMNHTFKDFLDKFVLVYLDDILVFSENEQQHISHLRSVFDRLRQCKFRAKLRKCEFAKSSIRYLGHLVTNGKVSVDPAKTEAIMAWPEPRNIKEVQQFVGLANYYNSFVENFAQLAAPLTALLQKGKSWEWTGECQSSFDKLKKLLCSSPILKLPDFTKQFVVETDCSDDAVGGVLLQQYEDGYHPVEYFSKKLLPAERNYAAHEREMLAIFKTCQKWRCYLDGRHSIVYTDHRALSNIWTQPHLSRRQARWLEKLSELSLEIIYRPGKLQIVSDTLSRVPIYKQDYLSEQDFEIAAKFLKKFAPQYSVEQCVNSAVEALSRGLRVGCLQCPFCRASLLEEKERAAKCFAQKQCRSCGKEWHMNEDVIGNPLGKLNVQIYGKMLRLQDDSSTGHQGNLNALVCEPSFLHNVKNAQENQSDAWMQNLWTRARQEDPEYVVRQVHGCDLVYRKLQRGDLQLVIPASRGIREMLLKELHTTVYTGHMGARKTLDALRSRVYWPNMAQDVTRFVRGCAICNRVKDVNRRPAGELAPLPIPDTKFKTWTMDFITDLPPIEGFNSLLVCVDKFSKFTRIIPCWMGDGQLSAQHVAQLFFTHIVSLFGVPDVLVHDRDPRFTSGFWQSLWRILGSKTVFSSAYHPQTDGQTERQNRTIEQCIRALGHEAGLSWLSAVPFVELNLNSQISDSAGVSPNMVVFGKNIELPVDKLDGLNANDRAQQQVTDWVELESKVKLSLQKAQESQKRFYDRRHRDSQFAIGDWVWLDARNIRQAQRTRKLADRFVGPFEILARVGPQAYRLNLTDTLRGIHNVFHVSLLKFYEDNGLNDDFQQPLMEEVAEEPQRIPEQVLAHGRRGENIKYLIKWKDLGSEENTWEDENSLAHAADMIQAYKTRMMIFD